MRRGAEGEAQECVLLAMDRSRSNEKKKTPKGPASIHFLRSKVRPETGAEIICISCTYKQDDANLYGRPFNVSRSNPENHCF